MILTPFAASLAGGTDANQNGFDGYTVGTTYVRLQFEWRLTQEQSDVGKAANPQHTSTVIFQFPVARIVARRSSELRMLAFMMHIVRFSFPLPGELYANEDGFLGISPLIYMARCTTGEVSLFSVIVSSLREDIDTPTTRTSGVLSPRRCEQINYLGWVRVIIFLFLLLNNEYPQLALLFHALVSFECHLSTTVSLT